ncbi:TPA: LPD7 domain-containing protein [Klebsiella pneumoniae]
MAETELNTEHFNTQQLEKTYADAVNNVIKLRRDLKGYEETNNQEAIDQTNEQIAELKSIQNTTFNALGYVPQFDDLENEEEAIPDELKVFAQQKDNKSLTAAGDTTANDEPSAPAPAPVQQPTSAEPTEEELFPVEPKDNGFTDKAPVAAMTVANDDPEPAVKDTTEQDILELEELHNANKGQSFNSKTRFLDDEDYHRLFDNIGRIGRSLDGQKRIVYFKDNTQLLERTDSIVVMARNQIDSARRLVLVAKEKGWNTVTFQGNSSFLENAYLQAVQNGVGVKPLSEEQRQFYKEVHDKFKLDELGINFLGKKSLKDLEEEKKERELAKVSNAEPEKKPEIKQQKEPEIPKPENKPDENKPRRTFKR